MRHIHQKAVQGEKSDATAHQALSSLRYSRQAPARDSPCRRININETNHIGPKRRRGFYLAVSLSYPFTHSHISKKPTLMHANARHSTLGYPEFAPFERFEGRIRPRPRKSSSMNSLWQFECALGTDRWRIGCISAATFSLITGIYFAAAVIKMRRSRTEYHPNFTASLLSD